jgi:hypothetical protein
MEVWKLTMSASKNNNKHGPHTYCTRDTILYNTEIIMQSQY